MVAVSRGAVAASTLTLVALGLAACGNSDNTSSGSGGSQGGSYGYNQTANVNNVGKPVGGGTLRIVGNADRRRSHHGRAVALQQ